LANAICVIHPYLWQGEWVFDDDRVGLVREPFVAGADEIIDKCVTSIADAESGFRLQFSPYEFPGYDIRLDRSRIEGSGTWYRSEKLDMEGWLCPALLLYFEEPPETLYAKFGPKKQRAN